MKLENKVAVVTGGASGIGKAIVEMLLDNSSIVVVLDKDQNALNNLNANDNTLKIRCDLKKESDIRDAINQTTEKYNKIDILVNNAGILFSEPLVNIMVKDKRHNISTWQSVIDLNLTAPFVIGSYIAENMILNRTKGVIVNISSISAKGNAGQSAYSAAKAGLESLTMVWAKELGSFGIRSIAIAPGFIDTPSAHMAVSKDVLEHVKNETPLKRLGKVENIACGVRFAIENNYINGKTIDIDGGLVI